MMFSPDFNHHHPKWQMFRGGRLFWDTPLKQNSGWWFQMSDYTKCFINQKTVSNGFRGFWTHQPGIAASTQSTSFTVNKPHKKPRFGRAAVQMSAEVRIRNWHFPPSSPALKLVHTAPCCVATWRAPIPRTFVVAKVLEQLQFCCTKALPRGPTQKAPDMQSIMTSGCETESEYRTSGFTQGNHQEKIGEHVHGTLTEIWTTSQLILLDAAC